MLQAFKKLLTIHNKYCAFKNNIVAIFTTACSQTLYISAEKQKPQKDTVTMWAKIHWTDSHYNQGHCHSSAYEV